MDVTNVAAAYGVLCAGLGFWNRHKGHGFWLGFFFSLLLTPVIGFLTVALSPAMVVVATASGRKRSCPHCFELTRFEGQFCDSCGRNIRRETLTGFLRLGELFIGLVATIIVVRLLMVNPFKSSKPTSMQKVEQSLQEGREREG